MKLAWHDLARDELREALLYYREHAGQRVAENFNTAVMRVAKQLLQFPELGSRTGGSARRFPMHDYPYSLVYRVDTAQIHIIAVANQSRRPGYWAGRW